MNCVVALASDKHMYPVDPHGGYQNSYPYAGGIEVTGAAATTGDIIQVGEHDTDPVLHTAIITATGPDGTFTVVDANWVGVPGTPELVGVHDYTPPRTARFWRLGSLGTKPATRTAAAQTRTNPVGTPSQTPVTAPIPPVVPTTADAWIAPGTLAVTVTGSNSTTTTDGGRQNPVVAVRLYLDQLPYTTQSALHGKTVLTLDTGNVPDGPHHLAAQAITAAGAISPPSTPLASTVANTTFAVAPPHRTRAWYPESERLGFTTDGHTGLITLAADGHTATATPTLGTPNADKTAVLAAGPHRNRRRRPAHHRRRRDRQYPDILPRNRVRTPGTPRHRRRPGRGNHSGHRELHHRRPAVGPDHHRRRHHRDPTTHGGDQPATTTDRHLRTDHNPVADQPRQDRIPPAGLFPVVRRGELPVRAGRGRHHRCDAGERPGGLHGASDRP